MAFTFAALLLWAVPATAQSTYVVDLPGDFGDSTPGDDSCAGGPGGCSLRAAVEEANAHAGPDIVQVPPDTYELDLGTFGSLEISSAVVIDGTGSAATTTIKPAAPGVGRLFDVLGGGDLTLVDATVRGATLADSGAGIRSAGTLTVRRSVIADNESNNEVGAAIATKSGAGTTLIDSSVIGSPDGVIPGNRAGGSAFPGNFRGGAIAQDFGTGTMTIRDSKITGNSLTGEGTVQGAGIYGASPVVIEDSEINDNTATATGSSGLAQGAGILQQAGELELRRSTVHGNTAVATGGGSALSGGVEVQSNGSLIEDSTIAGNAGQAALVVTGLAGAASTVRGSTIEGPVSGIQSFVGLDLENSTVSGSGTGFGLGAAFGADLAVAGSTISGHATGVSVAGAGTTVTVRGTIVADNGIGCEATSSGVITSAGGNVEDGDDCGLSSADDLTNADPLLGPLADNGGLTETRSISANSPAVDNFTVGCPPPATDQRGLVRPQGVACDSGAFELADTEVTGPAVIAKKKQKQNGKKIKIKIKAGAQEPVDLIGRGRITVKGKARKFKLKTVRKSTDAGRRTVLRLTPKRKRDNKRIFRLLRRRVDLRANPSVKLSDAAGNSVTENRVVRLKPKQ